jgi:hypothetical protein
LKQGILLLAAGAVLFLYLQNMQMLMHLSLSRLGEKCFWLAGEESHATCMSENVHQLGLYASGAIAVIGLIFIARDIFQRPRA